MLIHAGAAGTLISEVIVTARHDERRANIEVQWEGGARTELHAPLRVPGKLERISDNPVDLIRPSLNTRPTGRSPGCSAAKATGPEPACRSSRRASAACANQPATPLPHTGPRRRADHVACWCTVQLRVSPPLKCRRSTSWPVKPPSAVPRRWPASRRRASARPAGQAPARATRPPGPSSAGGLRARKWSARPVRRRRSE